jgi:hypothetical protein
MRFTFVILLFCCFGADAQMIIKAHANYVPFAVGITPPLDIYTGAAAAYSLRKLRTAYTGSAIRVRRSNDNSEQDIGFTSSGDLDTVALKTFVGAGNNGFVTVWYDQSGNTGRNATQAIASRQPIIINAGIIQRNPVNNRVVLTYVALLNRFLQTSNQTFSGDVTMFGAYNITSNPVGSAGVFSYGEESNGKRRTIFIWNGGSGSIWYHYASAFAQNVQLSQMTVPTNTLTYALFNHTSQQVSGGVNGAAATTASRTLTNPAASPIYIGTTGSNEPMSGNTYEVILYNSNQSSNRTGIETNINSYYVIY